MNERHRQQQFKSPFDLELDPERKLWVPGKKKIFLPIPREKPALDFTLDWIESLYRPHPSQRRFFEEQSRDGFLRFLADCSPGRGEYLGVPRVTYNDIQRSTIPMWRR